MDEKFIIDTNIIIYYLDDKIPKGELKKLENIFIISFNISTITKIELLGWNKIDSKTKKKINEFFENANVHYVNSIIEHNTIELKQKYKIAIPDAVLAATALVNNFTLVTRNEKDFSKIKNLRIYNPFK